MAVNDTLLNIGMDAMKAAAGFLALHSADPGATGANLAASARVAANWGTSANGDTVATNRPFTGGAPSGPATHVGFWSAATGGTFYGSAALTGDQSFNAAGQYTVNSVALNGNPA